MESGKNYRGQKITRPNFWTRRGRFSPEAQVKKFGRDKKKTDLADYLLFLFFAFLAFFFFAAFFLFAIFVVHLPSLIIPLKRKKLLTGHF
ncbi:MAG: hypothetical protein A3J76_00325 [Candidatus Moranbacteria bacterium RBG_13_45_13]|nr:MAG: hypothetical protein A3J76_00325 [Candidatus Moranbacteria bacterium RBG_13_45_13]